MQLVDLCSVRPLRLVKECFGKRANDLFPTFYVIDLLMPLSLFMSYLFY